jgi:hypothetical protein
MIMMIMMMMGGRTLLVEPSALKHWIVAGIGLDKAHGSTGIMSFHGVLEVLSLEIDVVSPIIAYTRTLIGDFYPAKLKCYSKSFSVPKHCE